MIGLIAVLHILDLAWIPMFLLRHIVLFKQPATFAALVTCYLTSASTSPYPANLIPEHLNLSIFDVIHFDLWANIIKLNDLAVRLNW